MKHVKKLLSAVLVLVLALTMVLPVAAEGETTYSIKIKNDKDGHTYEAYQIFAGDLSKDANGAAILSNIRWGSGVNSEGLGEAKAYAASITEANAAQKAKELGGKLAALAGSTDQKTSITFGGATVQGYEITGLTPGYYLVKDQDGSLTADGHDAYTAYILQVVENVEAAPKSSVPSVDKQVHDEPEDAENGESTGWGETADHAINESFQFKLTATLPVDIDIANYNEYKVVFTDTMSDGITFESIAENGVTINGIVVSNYTTTATANQKGGSWELTIDDIKEVLGKDYNYNQEINVQVVYNAHLNENAAVNIATGATNNKNTVGLEYSNNPNGTSTGKTPEDHVWVFTYEVDNNKVNENNQPLAGAGFKLYAADADGKITETEIPVVSTGKPGEYRLATGTETGIEMLTTDATNVFNIKGLDAGKYFLKETTTPDGYNTCEPKLIIIDATHEEDEGEASATTTLTNESAATMNNTIQNNKGTTLPGTGGIGTTIFYVVGGILVVGAAVLLIAKKRTKM